MKVKVFGIILVCIIAIGIMWEQVHMSYEIEDNHNEKNVSENIKEESVDVKFPERIKTKVSEGFSYDAEIVTGENFDPDHFYQCTATIVHPDTQKWTNYFGVNDENWNIEEADFPTRDHKGGAATICQAKSGDVLYVGQENVIYAVDDMVYIHNILDTNDYSTARNVNLFSAESNLSFQSRIENWNMLIEFFNTLGINISESNITAEYSLDIENIKQQEQVRYEMELIDENEKKESWSKEEEGYYYFIVQEYQGLPVFRFETTAYMFNEFEEAALKIYAAGNGIWYINMQYWFEFKNTDEKYTLVPFETIMETINKKYCNIISDSKLEVKKCELMLYPLNVGEDELKVIPVWLCTIQSSNIADKIIYLPINALTGEEVFEMEEG